MRKILGIAILCTLGATVARADEADAHYRAGLALKKQGKPLPEVIAAKPGARYDAEWGNLFQNPSDFVALAYQGV